MGDHPESKRERERIVAMLKTMMRGLLRETVDNRKLGLVGCALESTIEAGAIKKAIAAIQGDRNEG